MSLSSCRGTPAASTFQRAQHFARNYDPPEVAISDRFGWQKLNTHPDGFGDRLTRIEPSGRRSRWRPPANNFYADFEDGVLALNCLPY
jgi:hypothetical protein